MDHRSSQPNEVNRGLRLLTTWGPIIALAASFIMGWATLQANVQNLSTKVTNDEKTMSAQASSQTQIQVQLSQIQTDIQWIKADLQGKVSSVANN